MRRRGCTPETKRLRSRYYGGIDMKKAVSLMMAAAMTMGLAACGSTASTDTAASAADTASSTEAAASTADSTAAADGKVYNIGICPFSSLFIAAMTCGDKSTFQMDVISFHRLPKLVILLTILESCTLQFLDKHLFLKMHIVTQFIKRRIIITQFHIDEAEKHHRIFRKCHSSSSFLNQVQR